MDIFNDEPKDWVELQDKVAYILGSCGYIVETPKKIQTARGEVEIDVFAQSSEELIICECKFWESNVPQNTVFAFRTIAEDIGANKGIIVAKKGFQSGAYISIILRSNELNTSMNYIKVRNFTSGTKALCLSTNLSKFQK